MYSYHFARLEERILLDGSIAAVVSPEASAANEAATNAGNITDRVLVITADTPQLSAMTSNTQENVHVVVYDPTSTSLSGLQQEIAQSLNGAKASSIGFLNRGTTTQFALSSSIIVNESSLMSQPEMQQFWMGISSHLTDAGQIDLLASGNLSPNVLMGIQMLTHANVSETTTLTGSDLLSGGAQSHYFNDNIVNYQDQLLTLLHSTSVISDSTTQLPSSPMTDPNLVHFSISLNADALGALIPEFSSTNIWDYTMSPNQDGSMNVFLSLNTQSNFDLSTLDTTFLSQFMKGGQNTTVQIGEDTGQNLHINLFITRDAFSLIESTLKPNPDLTIQVKDDGSATVITNGFDPITNTTIVSVDRFVELYTQFNLNNSSLFKITTFNNYLDLEKSISTSAKSGIFPFSPDAHPDKAVLYKNSPAPSMTSTVMREVIDYNLHSHGLGQTDNGDSSAMLVLKSPHQGDVSALILSPALSGIQFVTHLKSSSEDTSNPSSKVTIDNNDYTENVMRYSDQYLGQKTGQPFFPAKDKILNVEPIPETPMKSVIGALSWAEFKLDGRPEVPKESSLIQDFPAKIQQQTVDSTIFSTKGNTLIKGWKGFLGLRD